MKLDRSEVLLLAHILYHSKVTNGIDWDENSRFDKLYKKLTSYLTGFESDSESLLEDEVEDRTNFIKDLEASHDDDCPLQDDYDSQEDDDQQFDYSVTFSDLIKLEKLTVKHDGEEKIFKFVPGINSRTLDVDFNGDEIICDVDRIIRKEKEIQVRTVMGWLTLNIEHQVMSWNKLLPLDEVGIVEQGK